MFFFPKTSLQIQCLSSSGFHLTALTLLCTPSFTSPLPSKRSPSFRALRVTWLSPSASDHLMIYQCDESQTGDSWWDGIVFSGEGCFKALEICDTCTRVRVSTFLEFSNVSASSGEQNQWPVLSSFSRLLSRLRFLTYLIAFITLLCSSLCSKFGKDLDSWLKTVPVHVTLRVWTTHH